MPFSQSSQLSAIVGFIEALKPASLLDVGAGMGQYGFLARMNLENVNLFRVEGEGGRQATKAEWSVRIDGIEACASYLTPVHEYAYDHIFVGDALAILPTLANASYDLAMAIDIVEHFEAPDGLRFLAELKRVARRTALVSTPKAFVHQEVAANPYENHRSHWTAEQLAAQGFTRLLANEQSWIAIADLG